MDEEHDRLDRRDLLKRGAAALTLLTTASFAIISRPALAQTSAKADFHYRDSPKDGNKCSDCSAFVTENSSCKVFGEAVSPNGWCMAFSKGT